MKRLVLILLFSLTACKEVDQAKDALAKEPSTAPPSVEDPAAGVPGNPSNPLPSNQPACRGDFLVGTWATTSDAAEVWTFNEDCTGTSYKCAYQFTYPAEGSADWMGSYNFRIHHTTGPSNGAGCTQYQSTLNGASSHICNIYPTGPDRMRMDCNGELNSYYFDRQ